MGRGNTNFGYKSSFDDINQVKSKSFKQAIKENEPIFF